MTIWVLVVGISLLLSGGKLDVMADVEHVFPTEKSCLEIKAKLDAGSKEAITKGEVNPQVNSFGATCVPVILDIHNNKKLTGA